VLTKPDRIPEGSRDEKLRAIFENKRFILGHGYFVVRNLGQDQIDDGLTLLRQQLPLGYHSCGIPVSFRYIKSTNISLGQVG
jgi:hypothetical protein